MASIKRGFPLILITSGDLSSLKAPTEMHLNRLNRVVGYNRGEASEAASDFRSGARQPLMAYREPVTIELPGEDRALDEAIAATPDRSAVFLLHPHQGRPYLARTGSLRRRLHRILGRREQPSRFLHLRGIADRLDYWITGSHLESSLLFYEVARLHFPVEYAQLIKLRMPPYVKLLLGNPFPRTLVTSRLSGAGAPLYFGPFPTRQAAEQFESGVLDLFQIRRCQEDLAPAPTHPGCIYGEMNMCLRPCQEAVGREEYLGEVDRVAEFLSTGGASLLAAAESARDKLSQEMNFEEAARQHRRAEKIREVLRSSGELAREIGGLNVVVVTPSAEGGCVELWFVLGGCWHSPVTLRFEPEDGKAVSLDHRLRELAAGLRPPDLPVGVRQEHLALLARWFYSTWRDGEWLLFRNLEQLPYRKLVRAISRVSSQSRESLKPGDAPATSGR
jgi:excinuclease ABC subunit C